LHRAPQHGARASGHKRRIIPESFRFGDAEEGAERDSKDVFGLRQIALGEWGYNRRACIGDGGFCDIELSSRDWGTNSRKKHGQFYQR
jgi:hypothetical protein